VILFEGKYNTAKVHTFSIEESAANQIRTIVNNPNFTHCTVVVMPDVHAGADCVVGLTIYYPVEFGLISPNLIGVDIGCGVGVLPLGDISIDFKKLDEFIYANIPNGKGGIYKDLKNLSGVDGDTIKEIRKTSSKIGLDPDTSLKSIGTLGGGNHFIEIDKDISGCCYLVLHSGSRKFGFDICNYHQAKAVKSRQEKGTNKDLSGLTSDTDIKEYLGDMRLGQEFAMLNRLVMISKIYEFITGRKQPVEKIRSDSEYFESVHNYISFTDNVLRKGAISAHRDEKVVIPLNMAAGCILGTGRGNDEWNWSAPHGAGRIMSRGQAKRTISLDEYERAMGHVYSTSVNVHTIDEAPGAYKSPGEIISTIQDTVEIKSIIIPKYSFKASSKE
jgi:RNA-splicing ligase RtcB